MSTPTDNESPSGFTKLKFTQEDGITPISIEDLCKQLGIRPDISKCRVMKQNNIVEKKSPPLLLLPASTSDNNKANK